MIDYKIYPAIFTKSVVEYCSSRNILIPNEYIELLNLHDTDPIGIKMVINALEYVESLLSDDTFYIDFIKIIESRWVDFIECHTNKSHTQVEKLANFYNTYTRMASVDWVLLETDTSLCLTARRNGEKSCSKFDDLNLYYLVSKIVNDNTLDERSPLSVSLPFSRGFYNKYIENLENVSFNAGNMLLHVKKTERERETTSATMFNTRKCEISLYQKVVGAANMIPTNHLNLSSLSFVLGISPRSLQRILKNAELSANHIIRDVKFNHAKNAFLKNNLNIKKTSLECGFKEQGQLTTLFYETSGMSPSQYKKLIEK